MAKKKERGGRKRFPFKPGTWVRIFYLDAKHFSDTDLKEAKKEGLWVREIRGVYMGCSATAFFFTADYVHGAESQDLEAIPRDWVYLDKVKRLEDSDYEGQS